MTVGELLVILGVDTGPLQAGLAQARQSLQTLGTAVEAVNRRLQAGLIRTGRQLGFGPQIRESLRRYQTLGDVAVEINRRIQASLMGPISAFQRLNKIGRSFLSFLFTVTGPVFIFKIIRDDIQGAIEYMSRGEQALNSLTAVYGNAAQSWIRWSQAMREETGVAASEWQMAAVRLASLNKNYGISVEQLQLLATRIADVAVATGLAYDQNEGFYGAIARIESAIRGEAEAAERLGLNLQDNYMRQSALVKQYGVRWEKLDENTKAQLRFLEALRQTAYAEGMHRKYSEQGTGALTRLGTAVRETVEKLWSLYKTPVLNFLNNLAQRFENAGKALTNFLAKYKPGAGRSLLQDLARMHPVLATIIGLLQAIGGFIRAVISTTFPEFFQQATVAGKALSPVLYLIIVPLKLLTAAFTALTQIVNRFGPILAALALTILELRVFNWAARLVRGFAAELIQLGIVILRYVIPRLQTLQFSARAVAKSLIFLLFNLILLLPPVQRAIDRLFGFSDALESMDSSLTETADSFDWAALTQKAFSDSQDKVTEALKKTRKETGKNIQSFDEVHLLEEEIADEAENAADALAGLGKTEVPGLREPEVPKLPSADELFKPLTEEGPSIFQRLWDWLTNTASKARDLLNRMKEGLWNWVADTSSRIGDWVTQNGAKLGGWITDTGAKFGDWIAQTGSKLGSWVTQTSARIGDWVAQTGANLGSWFASTATRFGDWVTNTGARIGEWVTNSSASIGSWVAQTGPQVASWVQNTAAQFGSWVAQSSAWIGEWVATTATKIGGWIAQTGPKLGEWVNTGIAKFSEWVAQTGAQLGTWVTTGVTRFGEWVAQTGSYIGNWIMTTTSQYGGWVAQVGATIGGWLTNSAAQFSNWVVQTGTNIGTWITNTSANFSNWALQTGATISSWITNTITSFGNWITQTGQSIGSWISDTGAKFSTWVVSVGAQIGSWISTTSMQFSQWVTNVGASIGNWITDTTARFGEWVTTTGTQIGSWVTDTTKKIGDWITTTGGQFGQWISDTAARVDEWVTNTSSKIGNWVTVTSASIGQWVTNVGAKLRDWSLNTSSEFQNFTITFLGLVATWSASVIRAWSDTWTSLRQNLSSAWASIRSTLESLWGGLVSRAVEWGRNLVRNFVSGITSAFGWIQSAVERAASIVEKYLGSHSPAEKGPLRYADEWAPNLMKMFAEGALKQSSIVTSAAEAVASRFESAFTIALPSAPAVEMLSGALGTAVATETTPSPVSGVTEIHLHVGTLIADEVSLKNLGRRLREILIAEEQRFGTARR